MSSPPTPTTHKPPMPKPKPTPQALLRRGLALFNNGTGNLLEAGKILEQAARNNVSEPGEFWYALGKCRYALWEETWDDFIDEDGDGIDDRLEEVVGAYRRGLTFPDMVAAPKIFFATGQAYENYGSFEGAIQMYSHVISGFPQYTLLPNVILKAAAMCRHPKINKLDQATTYFEYLLDKPPLPYDSARIEFILAGCYQRQGRNNLAKDMYSDVLKQTYAHPGKKSKKTKQNRGKIPNIATWMSDPNMWRERAEFHFKAGIYTLAVDAMSQTLRLANNNGRHNGNGRHAVATTPEWTDWELLAISLGRINEKESALQALAKAFALNPYAEPKRLRQRIARWDPEHWGVTIAAQEQAATKCMAFYRGRVGARKGKTHMRQEQLKRKQRNRAANTIQYQYKFQLFRRKLKRQRQLVLKSLGRIAKRTLQFTWDSWQECVELIQYYRRHRHRTAVSIQLWFVYEKKRHVRKLRRAHNRNVVAKALEQMRTRIKRAILKAWEGYVVWIIDVKEPFNATTIQCWYTHIKWSQEFYRKRALILTSLNNIRLNFARKLFHHFVQVVRFQKMVRVSRTVHRPNERFQKCFQAWKYWVLEFLPEWLDTKADRKKERFYAIKRTAFRLVDANDLRIDPRNQFSILGLTSVGVAQEGNRTTSTKEKLKRMNRHPGIVQQLSRSLIMYEKICRLWREYYANREESQGVSFMHARLLKDTFDRAHLGSIYYKGIVQTALMKQELDRFRLTKIPLHPKLRMAMPGKHHQKPKTTLGTLFDKEKEQLERHFVDIHVQILANKGLLKTKAKTFKPPSMSAMALTLPNALRKQVHNFKKPGQMFMKKMSRLTGKHASISPFNLVPLLVENNDVYVDRKEMDDDDDEDDDLATTDEFGNDDPTAILKQIIANMGSPVVKSVLSDVGPAVTNRHAWGFPEYTSPGVYGVEGVEKAKNAAANDRRIAQGEWARMAREEVEQRAIDAQLLRKARENDYNRFARATRVCGPMAELDFFCALRPGRMYEQRAYVSACRIQLWALIWVPRRYTNRIESAIDMARIVRGHLARKLLHTKLIVKKNIHKIKMRARNAAFRQWFNQWYNKKIAHKMLARLLNKKLSRSFLMWVGFIDMLHQQRLERLGHVYKKMLNAKLDRHFVKWADYVPQAKKIRRLMWKVMASHKMYLFDTWANNVEDIVEDRNEENAAIALQSLCRGWMGRRFATSKFIAYSKIALLLQRIVRGHVGRVKYKLHRKRKRDAAIRRAREIKIRKLRGSYNDQIMNENHRRFLEQMFVEDAARAEESLEHVKMKKKKRKEEKRKIKQLVAHIKTFYKHNRHLLQHVTQGGDMAVTATTETKWEGALPVPLKYMAFKPLVKHKVLVVIAKRWTQSINRSNAAMVSLKKFRATRPPPFSCLHCHETFVNERDLDHHVGCHVDRAQWLYTPEAFYEFGLAESGGVVETSDPVGGGGQGTSKKKVRERRMSSYHVNMGRKKR